jgi:hypothetical protein
LNKF